MRFETPFCKIRRYIIKRRSYSPSKCRRILFAKIISCVLFVAIFLSLFNLILYKKTASDIMPLAVAENITEINEIAYMCMEVSMNKLNLGYSDYCVIHYNEDGSVSSLSANSLNISRLKSELVSNLANKLDDLKRGSVAVPLGNIIYAKYFGGRGFDVYVKTSTFTSVSSEISSEFSDSGINQTLHRIIIDLKIEMIITCMGQKEKREVVLKGVIAESIIVGKIPSIYS